MRLRGEERLMGQNVPRLLLATMAVVLSATMLAGCGSIIADHLPTPVGGLPEGGPDRPIKQSNFPAVHDFPTPRASTVLTDAEQKTLEDDLIAARARIGAAARAGTRDN
jgi:outer membrane murein-binding lipoprotein Lpp